MSYDLLRAAIYEHHSMMTNFENYIRYFCPYRLGFDADGNAAVVVFQYGGGKPGGLAPHGEWHIWKVAELGDVHRINEGWKCGPALDAPTLYRVEITAAALQ